MELSFIYCCCVCNGINYAVCVLLFPVNTLSLRISSAVWQNLYPTSLKDFLLFVRRILKISIVDICSQ